MAMHCRCQRPRRMRRTHVLQARGRLQGPMQGAGAKEEAEGKEGSRGVMAAVVRTEQGSRWQVSESVGEPGCSLPSSHGVRQRPLVTHHCRLNPAHTAYNRGGGPAAAGGGGGGRPGERQQLLELVHLLEKKSMLPVAVFCFSKKRCVCNGRHVWWHSAGRAILQLPST
jgi:hypothetical protein